MFSRTFCTLYSGLGVSSRRGPSPPAAFFPAAPHPLQPAPPRQARICGQHGRRRTCSPSCSATAAGWSRPAQQRCRERRGASSRQRWASGRGRGRCNLEFFRLVPTGSIQGQDIRKLLCTAGEQAFRGDRTPDGPGFLSKAPPSWCADRATPCSHPHLTQPPTPPPHPHPHPPPSACRRRRCSAGCRACGWWRRCCESPAAPRPRPASTSPCCTASWWWRCCGASTRCCLGRAGGRGWCVAVDTIHARQHAATVCMGLAHTTCAWLVCPALLPACLPPEALPDMPRSVLPTTDAGSCWQRTATARRASRCACPA